VTSNFRPSSSKVEVASYRNSTAADRSFSYKFFIKRCRIRCQFIFLVEKSIPLLTVLRLDCPLWRPSRPQTNASGETLLLHCMGAHMSFIKKKSLDSSIKWTLRCMRTTMRAYAVMFLHLLGAGIYSASTGQADRRL
jgi:hypothetical protein